VAPWLWTKTSELEETKGQYRLIISLQVFSSYYEPLIQYHREHESILASMLIP